MTKVFLVIGMVASLLSRTDCAEDELSFRVSDVRGDLVYMEDPTGFLTEGSTLTSFSSSSVQLEVVGNSAGLAVAVKVDPLCDITVGSSFRVENSTDKRGQMWHRRRAYATRVVQGPEIDGDLNDAVWSQSRIVDGFSQLDPDHYRPSRERTTARILFDDNNIYFGITCYVGEGARLIGNNMRRDADLNSDDHVAIILDTYNNRQNGFHFICNLKGAQRDQLLSNAGRSFNADWNCIWRSRTKVYEDRWTAEIAIPFDQLRFKPKQKMIWGLNITRRQADNNEWSQFVVDRSANFFARRWTREIGELHGLDSISPGRVRTIKPYLLPGVAKSFGAEISQASRKFESGADIRYGITSNLTLDLSYNTDFAQVEGDQEQVNLTQFRTFVPEKREFFLEGSTLFQFGEEAENQGNRPPTALFYSRQIGVEEGIQTPVILGAKLTGKVGKTGVGVLNVLTDEAFLAVDGDTVTAFRKNYSVTRIKRDLLQKSALGLILVNKQSANSGGNWSGYNRAAGLDFTFGHGRSNLTLSGFGARTWDSAENLSGDAGYVDLRFSGKKLNFRAKYLQMDSEFYPGVGFVNRRGDLKAFRRYDLNTWGKLSHRLGLLFSGPVAQVLTDLDNNLQFFNIKWRGFWRFRQGDWFRSHLVFTEDTVNKPFAPSRKLPETKIPQATHRFVTLEIGPNFSSKRRLASDIYLKLGSYYTGRKTSLIAKSRFSPSGSLLVQANVNSNWIRLPEANFNITTLSARVLYSFTTDFFVKLFTQWNNDREKAGINFLLNYRYRPGSDVFLVYDNGYTTADGFQEKNRTLLLKIAHTLRL